MPSTLKKGRSSALVHDLRTLQERIERRLEGVRSNTLRRLLYLELLTVLNGTSRFQSIPQSVSNTTGLTDRIYRRVNGPSGNALPRAIYESAFYDRSINWCVSRGLIRKSEWTYVNRLARQLQVEPSFGQESVARPPGWMIDVDETHQDLRVWIREPALQDMLLAGIETYLVPAGSGRPNTEIYGLVFGSHREAQSSEPGRRHVSLLDINIERVCVQHRARGSPSEVVADWRSERTHLAAGAELFPFWQVLGDFHTHTYRTLTELRRQRGWCYSEWDEKVNIEWCERMRSDGHRPRVALILAITRAARQRSASREQWGGLPNVIKATVGRCHCLISAYRIRPDGRYSADRITLKCPHLVGHSNGDSP